MNTPRKVLLAAGLLVLALLVAVLIHGSRSDGTPSAPLIPENVRLDEGSLPAPDLASVEPSSQAAEQRREVLVAPSPTDASPATGIVQVRVVRADGAAAVGFGVRVKHEHDAAYESLELVTDEQGLARFEVRAPARILSVSVLAGETTPPVSEWLLQPLHGGAQIDVELVITDGHSLSGRVVDAEGGPVPGAEVLAWCSGPNDGEPDRTTQADNTGAFRLEHLGPNVIVTARAEGLACSRGLRGQLSAGVRAEGLLIELVPAKTLRGVVLDPQRVAVAGAEVWVTNGLSSRSNRDLTTVAGITTFAAGRGRTHSDGEGRFEITGLSLDRHSLHVKLSPFLVYTEWQSTGPESIEVVLDAGLTLRGRVMDAQGRPAAGAVVRFWPSWSNVQTTDRDHACDDNGEFRLGGMIAKSDHDDLHHVIAVLHGGHAIEVVAGVKPSLTGGEYVDIRLVPERIIAGIVTDTEGAPAAGIKVWIEGDREMDVGASFSRRSTWEYNNGLDEVETSADGRFRFEQLYDGTFTVHAIAPGNGNGNETVDHVTRSGNEEITLVLDPRSMRKVVLTGTVRDAETGEPVTKFRVWPMIDHSGFANAFEDPDGRFELSGLRAGPIGITIRAEGYAQRVVEDRDYDIGEHRLDFTLARERSVELVVVDEDGEPHRRGEVEVLDLEGKELMFGTGRSRSSSTRIEDGRAQLHGLPAERLTLRVKVGPRDSRGVHDHPIDLTRPLDAPIELVIGRLEAPPRTVSLSFLVLVVGVDQDEKELREGLRSAIENKDRSWLAEALKSSTLVFPDRKLDVAAYQGDDPLTQASVTPTADGKFLCETGSSASYWGGTSSTMSSSFESEMPQIELNLPASRIRIEVSGEGYQKQVDEIDCSVVGANSEPRFLLLRRK